MAARITRTLSRSNEPQAETRPNVLADLCPVLRCVIVYPRTTSLHGRRGGRFDVGGSDLGNLRLALCYA